MSAAAPPRQAPGRSAKAGRERQCIVARTVMPEHRLIRLVIGPDGALVPDLAAKLPGRGAWIEAARPAVETAVRKNLFARAFQRPVKPPADFADTLEAQLAQRCLSLLGLARRAGELSVGYDQVRDKLKTGKPAWLILAQDSAEGGRTKILRLARATEHDLSVAGCFLASDMGEVLGRGPTMHLALRFGPSAARFTQDVGRLSGFRPLAPTTWLDVAQVDR